MLSKEILPPDRKKYLSVKQQVDWQNPFMRLNLDGTITVTTAALGTKQIDPAELHSLLIGLAASDWPFGRVVALQPCSARSNDREQFEKEDKALKTAWSRMRTTMIELEVLVNLWPSSD